jgi:hypothetical protein
MVDSLLMAFIVEVCFTDIGMRSDEFELPFAMGENEDLYLRIKTITFASAS